MHRPGRWLSRCTSCRWPPRPPPWPSPITTSHWPRPLQQSPSRPRCGRRRSPPRLPCWPSCRWPSCAPPALLLAVDPADPGPAPWPLCSGPTRLRADRPRPRARCCRPRCARLNPGATGDSRRPGIQLSLGAPPPARRPRYPARSPRGRRPPAALLGGAQQPDHRRCGPPPPVSGKLSPL